MAALTRAARVVARAASRGEGAAIASLWRELWEAHERWGGYPGSRDPRVYAQIAARLDDEARVRAGHPMLGRHVHLVADYAGDVCGQVEGWLERYGVDSSTPFTCEVRSLVVRDGQRRMGAGRILLGALAESARTAAGQSPCLLAAEVLEPNPAHAFYTRVGYLPVSWNARIDASLGARIPGAHFSARSALPADALAIAHLEGPLAARRRLAGDLRFDRPRAVDAAFVGAIAAYLASDSTSQPWDPTTLVAADGAGVVQAVARFTLHNLEPPFVPMRRALIGRFSISEAQPARPLVLALVSLACRLAETHGAAHLELADLSAPGTPLHDAALATGARAWSRVVTRSAARPARTARDGTF